MYYDTTFHRGVNINAFRWERALFDHHFPAFHLKCPNFFAYFALFLQCIYLYYDCFVCFACLESKAASTRAPTLSRVKDIPGLPSSG